MPIHFRVFGVFRGDECLLLSVATVATATTSAIATTVVSTAAVKSAIDEVPARTAAVVMMMVSMMPVVGVLVARIGIGPTAPQPEAAADAIVRGLMP